VKTFDSELILKAMADHQLFADMKEGMAEEVLSFGASFEDDPTWISSWGHHYFCKEDGSALIYNPKDRYHHECPLCHQVYDDEVYSEVWVYKYRNEALLTCYKAAVLYKLTKDVAFFNIFKDISEFYIDHYEEFPLHNKLSETFDSLETMSWGCGRLMPQGLNECIGLIRLFAGMTIIKDDLSQEYLGKVDRFVVQVFDLLKPQVDKIHNISCWVNSGIGCLGLFAGNQEMIDFAFEGDLNIRRQLREGVTDDGFWHEGSIHYNFFTLEGISYLALMAKTFDYDFGKELDIVKYMFEAAYKYSFDNHRLPNPNDGWPDVNLKTYSFIYSVGSKVFGYESVVGRILASIINNDKERQTVPLSKPYYYKNLMSLEQFTYIPDFTGNSAYTGKKVSTDFHTSNFTLLKRDDLNLFFKYGHNSPSHAHPDKMTVELMDGDLVISRDLSNAGYCSKMCNEWHRTTLAHNTVVVDGENHVNVEPGELLEFKEYLIDAKAKDVYKNVDFRRRINLLKNGFEDEFFISSDEEHVYDYVFHVEGQLIDENNLEDSTLGFSSNGYQHVKDIMKRNDTKDNPITWKVNDTRVKAYIEGDGEVFLCQSPDNPISGFRSTLVVRKKASTTKFKLRWELS